MTRSRIRSREHNVSVETILPPNINSIGARIEISNRSGENGEECRGVLHWATVLSSENIHILVSLIKS